MQSAVLSGIVVSGLTVGLLFTVLILKYAKYPTVLVRDTVIRSKMSTSSGTETYLMPIDEEEDDDIDRDSISRFSR